MHKLKQHSDIVTSDSVVAAGAELLTEAYGSEVDLSIYLYSGLKQFFLYSSVYFTL